MRTKKTNVKEIKQTGLKVTAPRVNVLSVFETSKSRHLSAEDVYKVLLKKSKDIGLATVYRVLTHFEKVGILVRSNFESGKSVYEMNRGTHHDHLVCTNCGIVEEFLDPEIENRQKIIAESKGFSLTDHSLALYGVCSNCSSSTKKK